jgi:hypothetical protein
MRDEVGTCSRLRQVPLVFPVCFPAPLEESMLEILFLPFKILGFLLYLPFRILGFVVFSPLKLIFFVLSILFLVAMIPAALLILPLVLIFLPILLCIGLCKLAFD